VVVIIEGPSIIVLLFLCSQDKDTPIGRGFISVLKPVLYICKTVEVYGRRGPERNKVYKKLRGVVVLATMYV
jgi:hypothetical protein